MSTRGAAAGRRAAIDDATRIRALKDYPRHNQKNAIAFVEYVLEKFPFRVQSIRTDRGHEFPAKFHWHVEDKGIRHVYIKPRVPQLPGPRDPWLSCTGRTCGRTISASYARCRARGNDSRFRSGSAGSWESAVKPRVAPRPGRRPSGKARGGRVTEAYFLLPHQGAL